VADAAEWLVLLIGGSSGVGKTTVAPEVARRLGAAWLMVDDLRLALRRSGLPIPDSARVEDIHAPGGLVEDGETLTPAVEVVIEHHVDQRAPIVIEGDGILPSIFERPSVRERAAAAACGRCGCTSRTRTRSSPTWSPAAAAAGATAWTGTPAAAWRTASGSGARPSGAGSRPSPPAHPARWPHASSRPPA
jgi:hypothetical protein